MSLRLFWGRAFEETGRTPILFNFYAAVLVWFSGTLLTLASLITITAISLDFYLALHLHLRYKELVTVARMVRVVVGIWVFVFGATLLRIWCPKYIVYVYVSLASPCLLVTTTAYYKVFRIVHHHQTQIQTLELQMQEPADPEDGAPMNITEQRKSLIAKFLIYCLLIVCYVPVCVMMTVQKISGYGSANVQSMFDFSLALVCLNSTLNPFIYCWRFHNIRSAVIETARNISGYGGALGQTVRCHWRHTRSRPLAVPYWRRGEGRTVSVPTLDISTKWRVFDPRLWRGHK